MEASPDQLTAAQGLSVAQLRDFGLYAGDGKGIAGHLEFERPLWLFSPRHIRHCRFGAFSYVNGRGSSSFYRVQPGRYFQCAESAIIGPPDHPQDWFTTHPFGFTRSRGISHALRRRRFRAARAGRQQILPLHRWRAVDHPHRSRGLDRCGCHRTSRCQHWGWRHHRGRQRRQPRCTAVCDRCRHTRYSEAHALR